MTDPLDLVPVEARRFDALDADVWTTEQLHADDRHAITAALNDLGPLLAEVKRLRAQVAAVRALVDLGFGTTVVNRAFRSALDGPPRKAEAGGP